VSPCWWLLGPGLVLVGTALVWWSMRSDRQRLLAAVMHVARLRQICLRRVTIGLVGSPSSGKDSGIKALFGIDSGNISPIAGSTRQVSIQRVPGATALFVVNTPGLGDVVQAVTDEAKQILRHIDLYVYVVNSNGGVQARELEDYRACVASQKPVVAVLNKIDLMARPGEREKILAHSLATLGCAPEDLLCVAFAPKPVLSPNPIGIAELRAWLRAALVELGKDPAELDVASSTDPSAAPTLPGPAAPPLSPASSSPTT
jgi:predicted GTPase